MIGISQGSHACNSPVQHTWLREHLVFLNSEIKRASHSAKQGDEILENAEVETTHLTSLEVDSRAECLSVSRQETFAFCGPQFQPKRIESSYSLTADEEVKCALMTPSQAVQKLQVQIGIPYETSCGDYWCRKSDCEARALKKARGL